MNIRKEDALDYHSSAPAGKISVTPTKPCRTQRDLSLAYTPGVAVPCLEIQKDPSLAYKYTSKGNLVGVVSNGTAVLGLGNIGAQAGKPVMEGKGVLFKRFADIDVFDIELDTEDPQEVIRTCQLLEPTFGGINLEDIKAPDCFLIEEELRRTLRDPCVPRRPARYRDHLRRGPVERRSPSSASASMNSKSFSTAPAPAPSPAPNTYVKLGVRRDNISCATRRVSIYEGRTKGMNPYKERFAIDTAARTLSEALVGADVFFGLSQGNCVTADMIKPMADRPIIFALANPDPEIPYETAREARPDAIVATGRSTIPTRSTTSSVFRSSSAARSMCAPPLSTTK